MVVAVVVVVVPEELELLDESSFFAQEMTVRLKRDMRIICIILLSPSDLNPYYSKSHYSSSKCYLSA